MRVNSVISLVLIFVFSNILIAGIYTEESDGTKTYISNGKLKEMSKDGGMIMDSKSGEFIYFNHNKKNYTQGKISEFCEAMSKIMKQMMDAMPPEYKQMMGMDKKQEPLKVEIISKGDGGVIAGYKTTKFKVFENGKLDEEMWLAMDASLVKEFKSLVGMLSEFEKCSKMMDFGSPPVGLSPEYMDLMKKGLTLKSIQYQGDSEVDVTSTVKVEIKDIPDSEFKVPAGYNKMNMTDYFGSEMGGME